MTDDRRFLDPQLMMIAEHQRTRLAEAAAYRAARAATAHHHHRRYQWRLRLPWVRVVRPEIAPAPGG